LRFQFISTIKFHLRLQLVPRKGTSVGLAMLARSPKNLDRPSVRVGFSMRTKEEMAQQVATLLAVGEIQGSSWLHKSLTEVHLLPNSSDTGAKLRVVLAVCPSKDLGCVLSVDHWASMQTAELDASALERFDMPKWVVVNTKGDGAARTNLACAKHLAELVHMLIEKMKQVAYNDHRTLEFCFWKNMHNARYENPVPPPMTDDECHALMDRADACRDHILLTCKRTNESRSSFPLPLSFYKKIFHEERCTPHLLHPKEFPALGTSPSARGVHDPTKINKADVNKLWEVAWFGLIPGDHGYTPKSPEQMASESASSIETRDW
tara:strand:- start:2958 stop:3920 length:963 start_codon:yes stop_codon:yes gene_type:complete